MTKTVTIQGQEFVIGKVKAGVAKAIARENLDFEAYSAEWIAASLRAAGNEAADAEFVDLNIDYDVYNLLAMEVLTYNGFSKSTGEESAAPTA